MLKKISLKNISIGWKYGLSLIIVFVLFISSAIITFLLLNNIEENVNALERRGDRAIDVTEMGSITRSKSMRILSYSLNPDNQLVVEYEKERKDFNALEAELEVKMDTQEQLDLFNKISENDKLLNDIFFEKIIPAYKRGDLRGVESFNNQAWDLQRDTVNLLDALRRIVNDERVLATNNVKASQQITVTVLSISIGVSVIIGGLLVILISRVVSRNLKRVIQVSNRVANGDLTVDAIDYKGKDEIGKLAEATNAMGFSLKSIVKQISTISETVSSHGEELTQSANEVKAGSEQVATTMQELAAGSESQANNASDLSSSMSSFTTKVVEANENGEAIYRSSTGVIDLTEEGKKLMELSVQQMAMIDGIVQDAVQKVQELDTQSQEISKLVSVIKDIADQTNLLALNAAIEAARAGEQGRGFAVVADEVRKLAEQVGDSVTDITGIVGTIQNESGNVVKSLQSGYTEVEKGTEQINTTGETFEKISQAVSDMANSILTVTESLSTIAASSQQMNVSIEEIASISEEAAAGVEQTSASAQQTSSSMEEVAASSEELAKLAEELNTLVRRFKI